jgi:hypothetical protein
MLAAGIRSFAKDPNALRDIVRRRLT